METLTFHNYFYQSKIIFEIFTVDSLDVSKQAIGSFRQFKQKLFLISACNSLTKNALIVFLIAAAMCYALFFDRNCRKVCIKLQ